MQVSAPQSFRYSSLPELNHPYGGMKGYSSAVYEYDDEVRLSNLPVYFEVNRSSAGGDIRASVGDVIVHIH